MKYTFDMNTINTYTSPFSSRYGSPEMRTIFSEEYRFQLWRTIWVALASAQQKAGLITSDELIDLKKHQNNIDINRINEIEKKTKHDVVAAIREYAEKAKIGGGKIHLGATSMDIVDNADTLKMSAAIEIVEKKVRGLLKIFAQQIKNYENVACIGYTHLQPAEPTTIGYRLAFYAQDLLTDFEYLQFVKKQLKGKGFKGAVGTAASYDSVLKGTKMTPAEMEVMVMKSLGIEAATITTQVYSRKGDYLALSALSSIASSLSKFASDLRILQSPNFGEWSEPFGSSQVGSSAMPFKKNPITAENICSLARYIETLPHVALQNASHSYLERTLDDSANRRIIIPEAFLALDQILLSAEKILNGLVIHTKKVQHNLDQYAPFAATESILIAVVKKGADRQKMHELLREIAMEAWNEVQDGKVNPMNDLLIQNKSIQKYISPEEINTLLDVNNHIGDVSERINIILKSIEKLL